MYTIEPVYLQEYFYNSFVKYAYDDRYSHFMLTNGVIKIIRTSYRTKKEALRSAGIFWYSNLSQIGRNSVWASFASQQNETNV